MRQRVMVISDIHLSAAQPFMMTHPEALAAFIRWSAAARRDGEACELVIAGDFVDFLAVTPAEPFTRDPERAADKLRRVFRDGNPDVARALGEAIGDGVRLTVLAGNHDLELCYPQVQEAFTDLVGRDAERAVRFVAHGEAYRVGTLLIEHGNRYDGANENDWNGVRAWISSLSRGTASHRADVREFNVEVAASAGSRLVAEVIDVLRDRYPFVPLLQPEGKLTALLLLALEPRLRVDWNQIRAIFGAQRAQRAPAPGAIRNIRGKGERHAAALDHEFGDAYRELFDLAPAARSTAAGNWIKLYREPQRDSLSELLRRGERLPAATLRKLQAVLADLDLAAAPFTPDAPEGICGARARRMLEDEDIDTVIMGHTHQARRVGAPQRASYINTGTWSDVVLLPAEALGATEAGYAQLENFLAGLCRDDPALRVFFPTFADVVLEGSHVQRAELLRFDHRGAAPAAAPLP
jgi:UDP-2,3-diacylglucosamine pyrophosphatase LpxH